MKLQATGLIRDRKVSRVFLVPTRVTENLVELKFFGISPRTIYY